MLAALPAEDILFPQIFCRLTPSDLFHVRGCSSQLHCLVTAFFSQSRVLDLSYNKRLTKEAFLTISTSHHLRVLKLSGLKFLTDDLLRPVLVSNPQLLSLDVSDCQHLTSGILQTLAVSSFQLESLVLRDCHWVTREALDYHSQHQGVAQSSQEVLAQLSRTCIRVNTFRTFSSPTGSEGSEGSRGSQGLRGSVIKSSMPRPKSNLWKVELTGCWELNDKVLVNFLSNFPELRVVKLGNIYSVTDVFMKGLAKYSRNLEKLDISGCWRVSDQGVNIVGEYCKRLSDLRVTDCRDVSEQSLGKLRQRGVRIDRHLDPTLLRLMKIMHEQRHARLQT